MLGCWHSKLALQIYARIPSVYQGPQRIRLGQIEHHLQIAADLEGWLAKHVVCVPFEEPCVHQTLHSLTVTQWSESAKHWFYTFRVTSCNHVTGPTALRNSAPSPPNEKQEEEEGTGNSQGMSSFQQSWERTIGQSLARLHAKFLL